MQHPLVDVRFLVADSVFVKQELKDQIQDCHAQNKDLAFQSISGIRTVRSFKAEKEELRRYNKGLDHMCAVRTRSGIYSASFGLIRRVRWQPCTSWDHILSFATFLLLFLFLFSWQELFKKCFRLPYFQLNYNAPPCFHVGGESGDKDPHVGAGPWSHLVW